MRLEKSLAQSAKALIEAKIQALGVGPHFRVLFDRIETPGGGTIVFVGMANHTAELIKSLENCRIAWVEEAQNSQREASLCYARPFAPRTRRFGSRGIHAASRMLLMSSFAERSRRTPSW